MANVSVDISELVHLLRAGLMPDQRQFESLSRRMVRRLRRDYGETVDELVSVIETGSGQTTAIRSHGLVSPQSVNTVAERFLIAPQANSDTPILRDAVSAPVNHLILEQRSVDQLCEAGLVAARTALFVGPPGVGKTMTAQWVASQLGRPFLILNLASIMSSKLGQSGANVAEAMAYARATNAVLLLDEFDAVAKRRDDNDIGEAKRIVTVLLQEIDSWPETALLLAATNHGELLDRAVWRRFDYVIDFPNAGYDEALATAEASLGQGVDKKYIELTAKIFIDRPFSDIVKFCNNVKKDSILRKVEIEESFVKNLNHLTHIGSSIVQKDVAKFMLDVGFSQRQTSKVSGMARETLRKMKA